MKKIGFIIGSIEIILGLISLIITSLIQQIILKLARMCFMFNTGSFGEGKYLINTGFCNTVSIGLCLVGVITIIYFTLLKKEL